MEYLCKLSQKGWSFSRLLLELHNFCVSSYDDTIVVMMSPWATCSLLDLYLLNMKNTLFVAPESNRLCCACAIQQQQQQQQQRGLYEL